MNHTSFGVMYGFVLGQFFDCRGRETRVVCACVGGGGGGVGGVGVGESVG